MLLWNRMTLRINIYNKANAYSLVSVTSELDLEPVKVSVASPRKLVHVKHGSWLRDSLLVFHSSFSQAPLLLFHGRT